MTRKVEKFKKKKNHVSLIYLSYLACVSCKMNKRVLILFCLASLVLGFEDKTVTQYLADNGFTTLTGALQSTGLASTLDGSGMYLSRSDDLRKDHFNKCIGIIRTQNTLFNELIEKKMICLHS